MNDYLTAGLFFIAWALLFSLVMAFIRGSKDDDCVITRMQCED